METLREKLGPLPVWGWLALITAAGLAWWLISRRGQPTPQSAASDVPQTVIQTSITEPPDEDTDRERQRQKKARRHRHRPDRDREEDRESDKTEDREHQARHRNREREDREPHRPYHPPHGPAPTNHNPQRQAA